MKLEAVVIGVIRVVTINCKSTLPGFIYFLERHNDVGLL